MVAVLVIKTLVIREDEDAGTELIEDANLNTNLY